MKQTNNNKYIHYDIIISNILYSLSKSYILFLLKYKYNYKKTCRIYISFFLYIPIYKIKLYIYNLNKHIIKNIMLYMLEHLYL